MALPRFCLWCGRYILFSSLSLSLSFILPRFISPPLRERTLVRERERERTSSSLVRRREIAQVFTQLPWPRHFFPYLGDNLETGVAPQHRTENHQHHHHHHHHHHRFLLFLVSLPFFLFFLPTPLARCGRKKGEDPSLSLSLSLTALVIFAIPRLATLRRRY